MTGARRDIRDHEPDESGELPLPDQKAQAWAGVSFTAGSGYVPGPEEALASIWQAAPREIGLGPGFVCLGCGQYADHGVIAFGSLASGLDGEWVTQPRRDEHMVCSGCAAQLLHNLTYAVSTRPEFHGSRLHQCDLCSRDLGADAHTMELAPRHRGRSSHPLGAGKMSYLYRFDVGCLLWVRDLLSRRPNEDLEGDVSLQISVPEVVVAAPDLDPASRLALESILANAGGRLLTGPNSTAQVTIAPLWQPGRRGWPAPPEQPGKLVAALRPGASQHGGRWLIHYNRAPFTPGSAAGLLDRVLSDDIVGVGPSGWPVWRSETGRFGLPGFRFRIRCDNVRRLEVLLATQKALRSYDRVGLDLNEELICVVYCPDDAIVAVYRRLRFLLAPIADLDLAVRLEPSAAGLVTGHRTAAHGYRGGSPLRVVGGAMKNVRRVEDAREALF